MFKPIPAFRSHSAIRQVSLKEFEFPNLGPLLFTLFLHCVLVRPILHWLDAKWYFLHIEDQTCPSTRMARRHLSWFDTLNLLARCKQLNTPLRTGVKYNRPCWYLTPEQRNWLSTNAFQARNSGCSTTSSAAIIGASHISPNYVSVA